MLNPEQTIVETSNQPVYALSKILLKFYPDKFGQKKYFPMFGGFHIHNVVLENHGQLIAGSGLLRVLNYSKLSITGAGNIALNVPNITIACY